jgi:hypothetical protein
MQKSSDTLLLNPRPWNPIRALPKSQCIPMTCSMCRGAYARHNPGTVYDSKYGKQTPFIPSEVRKNLIGGLLIDLWSPAMAPDYAA